MSETYPRTDWCDAVAELSRSGVEMSHAAGQAGLMDNPPTPAEAEAHIRRLLEEGGLPPPDEVEHHATELVFLYHEQKLAFTFELDERPETPDPSS
jgi:hypothetical protein